MSEPLKHFLLIYDGASATLRSCTEFRRPGPAMEAFQAAEQQYGTESRVQVVLVAADSLATVKETHGNFWRRQTIDALIREALGSA